MNDTGLRIFISYAREDARELALRLRDDLQSVGHSAWLDLSEIAGGASWSELIEQAIEDCDVALTLLSRASYESQYCRAEQLRAIRKGKRVIPILVQADADLPLHLEHLNYLNFSNLDRYHDMLRDLFSDITAGRAFQVPAALEREERNSNVFKTRKAQKLASVEKRDAAAFRRYITELQQSPWLGARYWWPYFLFNYGDVHDIAQTLKDGKLLSFAKRHGRSKNRWDETVRLSFRPRTPELWNVEGIRPAGKRRSESIGVPVYLLFDLESVICQQDVRFSAADPFQPRSSSYSSARAFSELPFELIYHDSIVRPDEREEVMQSRRAQVIVPDEIGLESLQYVWCRSRAEYETLRFLLPDDVWKRWRDKVTCRSDYSLFHQRWAYVDDVLLTANEAHIRFNQPDESAGVFEIRVEAKDMKTSARVFWQHEDFSVQRDLSLDLRALNEPESYQIKVFLDDTLAYAGEYHQHNGLF